jgi:hypothetical protein
MWLLFYCNHIVHFWSVALYILDNMTKLLANADYFAWQSTQLISLVDHEVDDTRCVPFIMRRGTDSIFRQSGQSANCRRKKVRMYMCCCLIWPDKRSIYCNTSIVHAHHQPLCTTLFLPGATNPNLQRRLQHANNTWQRYDSVYMMFCVWLLQQYDSLIIIIIVLVPVRVQYQPLSATCVP